MRWILYFFFWGALACQHAKTGTKSTDLFVIYATALREAPGEKGAELVQLEPGAKLRDLGEVSPFTAAISLKDTLRQAPWLRVQANDGHTGWAFAGALRPAGQDESGVQHWIVYKRFTAWFGPALMQHWQSWATMPEPRSDSAAAVFFRRGLALRDTLNLLTSRRVFRDANFLPTNLFWLGDLSPLFVVQQTGNGTSCHLFINYRVLSEIAKKTTGAQDDAFARVCTEAFPDDSIESALPAWVFPLSAESGCSNLGQGNHLKILRSIDQALLAGDLFRPELMALKDYVLNDISDKNSTYWQPEEKILAELNKILESNLICINDRDRIALEARRKMFENPAENGILLDLRSGK